MSGSRRKPTGQTGHVKVSPAQEGPEFIPVPFPATKEAVERYVAFPFVQAAEHHGFFPYAVSGPLEQNPTDDFDFTMQTSDGPKYLELMEIHLGDIAETRGASAPSSYIVDVAARRVLEGIRAKSLRYRGATSREIILLTYITHWQFTLDIPVLLLLSYWMLRDPPVFERVFYMSFLETASVSLSLLYPIPAEEFEGFDPDRYTGHRVLNLNPRGWFQINE